VHRVVLHVTPTTVRAFLAARGKTGVALEDYLIAGDDRDGSVPTFPIWNVAVLGPAPTAADIQAMQRSEAQAVLDTIPIYEKAIVLALIDEMNRLRAALRSLGVAGLPDITPAMALSAIRQKAWTL
jgi:hypothetical protein